MVQEIVSRRDLGENALYVRAFLSATGSGGTGSRPVHVGGQHQAGLGLAKVHDRARPGARGEPAPVNYDFAARNGCRGRNSLDVRAAVFF